ncbi:MAG: 7-cyano-7-deazaguanine synthase QueC [Spirochaetota bacterium]|nr:7-cyano-7-deazaguanine synthase QueC [Spirochaetota bacterium]
MSKTLVLLSGGQDSTTCLFWAIKEFSSVEAISFDYGQRHHIELDSAKTIAKEAGVTQTVLPINTFNALGGNALTDQINVNNKMESNKLPNTFVPGRNLIFLSFAAAYAYQKEIRNLIAGMNQTDYSGYPDCRIESINAIQNAINLAMDYNITIHTPLMFKSKAEIWRLSHDIGCIDIVKKYSHSCYNGVKGGCNYCNACILREKGFKEFEKSFIP